MENCRKCVQMLYMYLVRETESGYDKVIEELGI